MGLPSLRFTVTCVVALAIGGLIGLSAGRKAPPPPQPLAAPPAPPQERVVAPPPILAALPPVERPSVAPVQPAWQRNAVAATLRADRKAIAIVIDDMGVDRTRSQRAANLPAPLTLSFLTYARDFESQMAAARARGHEILVHVPMEPLGAEDPGPGALRLGLSDADIRQRLAASLTQAGLAVGINNHMGSRFTADRRAMQPVLAELHARGLLFLDSRTAPGSVGLALAREMGVPHAARDVFLDNDPAPTAVRARLAETEAIARRQGYAVAIGHPHDGTLEVLAVWLREIGSRDIALVPISAIVRRQLSPSAANEG